MLQIGVGDRDERRGAGQHALDAGGREAASADALDAADSRIGARDFADEIGRAVAGIVVDENNFPADAGQHRVDFRDQRPDIVALVERRHDDRQFGRRGYRDGSRRDRNFAGHAP